MTEGTGYSLSDIVSATRSGDGMFGNGAYVVPATGSAFVILWNTPDCPAYATSQPVTTTNTTGE